MKSRLIDTLLTSEMFVTGVILSDEQIAQRRAFYELHDEAELVMELAAT
jgi:hypothetical protein